MIRCDVLVVGGGPGGSTCARELRKAGWDVVVADRARFPRDKVCAGWLTPRAFELLELDPAAYRASGLTLQDIRGFKVGVLGRSLLETRYRDVVSYAVRRCEFDHFLLRRADVRVFESTPVSTFRRSAGRWIVDEAIDAAVVVGAGGHFCPVAKFLRAGADRSTPVVAKEAEFPLPPGEVRADGEAPELFFCRDLLGYGWCVRKGNYLNVGIGRRESRDFGSHVKDFAAFLERTRAVVPPSGAAWRGHAYFASGTGPRPLVGDGMLVVGDAAGLAYPESGEGIVPAIESGRLAAQTLVSSGRLCDAGALQPYADVIRRLHPPVRVKPAPVGALLTVAGRVLLGSRLFTRRVVLDRWFLRTAGS